MIKDEMKMTFTQKITREEMKNRISLALKDPILQQGFEIVCKNLEELEKENKLLGERCNQLLKDKGDLIDKNKQLDLIILGNQQKIAELEQKIKWHDLREDPKDLPSKDDYQILITYVEYNHKWVTLGHYDQNTKKWFTSMELPLKKVIAWKTIIKLDKDVI